METMKFVNKYREKFECEIDDELEEIIDLIEVEASMFRINIIFDKAEYWYYLDAVRMLDNQSASALCYLCFNTVGSLFLFKNAVTGSSGQLVSLKDGLTLLRERLREI